MNDLLSFLRTMLVARLEAYFQEDKVFPLADFAANWQTAIPTDNLAFRQIIDEHHLGLPEFTALALALAPHLQPEFIDQLIQPLLPKSGDFPAIGGARGKHHRGFLPTGETVIFALGATTVAERLQAARLFAADHPFALHGMLRLEEVPAGEPVLSGRLVLHPDYQAWLMSGHKPLPRVSAEFPAQRLSTPLQWDDLILPPKTAEQLAELKRWVDHHRLLYDDWGMAGRLKPGYRALFYGPPGTGKTLAATLLGKYTGREVFRIDLSLVVSKYIGETEKNLRQVFERAKHEDWVLFFDEADALFGKRTNVRDAHDKYANQETAYLLQTIEEHPGVVILASNLRTNLDDAFTRRFQSIIAFPLPRPAEREQIWRQAWPTRAQLDRDVDNADLAGRYELSGANIMNVVQFACLRAIDRGDQLIRLTDVIEGIAREYNKEGKLL